MHLFGTNAKPLVEIGPDIYHFFMIDILLLSDIHKHCCYFFIFKVLSNLFFIWFGFVNCYSMFVCSCVAYRMFPLVLLPQAALSPLITIILLTILHTITLPLTTTRNINSFHR